MEQLGLGPEIVMQRNPAIIYGRMTGWGQTGPLATAPGHDINYIALAGALHAIGAKPAPVPPLVLAGDMGGGGTFLALGVLAAYIESQRSGVGQIVDAAIMEGAASLMTAFYGLRAAGSFVEQRESNRVDGGSHFYTVYETSDHEFISIGALEPKFYALLLEALELDAAEFPQDERQNWPKNRAALAEIFAQKTQAEWVEFLEKKNLCFAPVLKMSEAPRHPQNAARQNFVEVAGVTQPAPAPRFSRSQSAVQSAPAGAGEHTTDVLADWGFDLAEIEKLLQSGAAKQRAA
jgi:alpha-methylacyl-CoA racemase